jgi:7,8-dihydropterin-6-yl-methyl-4-(beta-D-ribofuranosyl)aminobenzene 5'-phosphate synthase
MKITALLENTTQRKDLHTEHGLSLYIETGDHSILFDMGQTDLFAKNAAVLGIDLRRVDIAVLSHGHYDHGGGLETFLQLNSKAPVYLHRDAFLPHYNGQEKYIGLNTRLLPNDRLIFTEDVYPICEGLTLFTCNHRPQLVPPPPSGLTEKVGDAFIPDDFRHEQYLLIEEDGKRILISGCSHKGIVNIARWFTPDVIVGGFHFSKLPPDHRLECFARALAEQKTAFYTGHCTGETQYRFMQAYMERLFYLATGDTAEL